jgi:choline monooxygenase
MTEIFSPCEIASLSAPIELARGLPPKAFFDHEIFEMERRRIFFDGWCAVGFSDFVQNPGDAMPVVFLGTPLVLVRQLDHSLKIFHNVVPYDSAPVLQEAIRNADQLIGAYHGFVYGLDGCLIDAPYWSGGSGSATDEIDVGRFNLNEIASAEWGRIVFANVSGNRASDFDAYISPMRDELRWFDFSSLQPGMTASASPSLWDCTCTGNWKTHHENACMNVYHENFVHEIYRNSPSIPRVTNGSRNFRAVDNRGVRGLAYTDEQAGETYLELPLPPLPRVTEAGPPSENNLILSLYPNLYVSIIGAHCHATIVTPLGPENVHLQSLNFFADTGEGQIDRQIIELIEAAWAQAVEEDGRIISAIQNGRRSPLAQSGHYAPFWDGPHYSFNAQVLADLLKGDG